MKKRFTEEQIIGILKEQESESNEFKAIENLGKKLVKKIESDGSIPKYRINEKPEKETDD